MEFVILYDLLKVIDVFMIIDIWRNDVHLYSGVKNNVVYCYTQYIVEKLYIDKDGKLIIRLRG